MLELAEAVLKVTGSSAPITHKPLPQDDPKRRCPDITRAKNLLDWEPRVDLLTGLANTTDYYRQVNEAARPE